MAAESVGLAASAAGLLSLGLQITGGIVKMPIWGMDAFEGRDEELRNVKNQNANLGATLHAIKTVLAGLQGQSPAVAAAVDQNIRSCEEDLRALEALCIELSDHAGSSWTNRLENKKKKVTFAFHRPKLRDLELQLQKAHGALQLIQGSLGLNTALLAAIESSSRDQASEMLLVRSEVAAFATPIAGIHDKLPDLQSSVDQTRQLIVAHSGAIEIEVHESSRRVRYDLQHSHNSIVEHLKTIDHKVQLLGEENSFLRALALRAASKPAVLKSLKQRLKASLKYTGVSRLLKSVIEISFALTWGAGGGSISPGFTYYPTADVNSDPAFRLISLMRRSYPVRDVRNGERFIIACLRKLAKLLEERRTYPTVVDGRNRTLMHHAAASVQYWHKPHFLESKFRRSSKELNTVAKIVPVLLSYDVPAFSYDISGKPHYLVTYTELPNR
ncbi:hypothetical protein CABS01_10159 [Colletotrichum abscissum]|uniref:uncharacterized protein n=1 Tax=Colletotrichum abscissum TaxID=1671311 RepID=UPI0027D4D8C0|nr:uncharacterized protein CABS01_10159 [Colletotrichum abscissum]KAK1500435.1 hypothetical protein CABS01_10159 [Colletotrichum abscissum]